MRPQQESNAINRVLKAWGLGSLNEPGAVEALSRMVQDHDHFGEILRACEPRLRREMYDSMSPNLRFRPRPLESYIIAAKEHASSQQFPTLTEDGNLKPYMMPSITSDTAIAALIEVPEVELWLQCQKCQKESFYFAERKADAISEARNGGWAYDEMGSHHICPNCLDEVPIAVD